MFVFNLRSWETIFSKSTLNITENELKCCYRIIDLCKDCVIIVYQYAFEQNNHDNKSTESSNNSFGIDLRVALITPALHFSCNQIKHEIVQDSAIVEMKS